MDPNIFRDAGRFFLAIGVLIGVAGIGAAWLIWNLVGDHVSVH